MFVFCSGLLVSLAFGVSCQRSRLTEIRWLNVKQPTSTRLQLERALTQSGLDPALSFRTHRHRRLRLDPARTGPDSNGISVVASSTQSRSGSRSTGHSRALSRLGDISKRPASLVLVWLSELALRPELRAFGQHSERS